MTQFNKVLFTFTPLLGLFLGCTSHPVISKIESKSEHILRIAFGSCNKVELEQPLWKPILDTKPDLWIWLGDNIYANTEDMDLMAAMYEDQNNKIDYKNLRESVPMIGIWDDHDFGENDGGKDFPKKKGSQNLLLNFLMEPASSPRRKQDGIYTTHWIHFENHAVKIILLDTRYNRESPGPESDILGEAQWQWLAKELKPDSAEVTIIASSTQVIPTQHRKEKWNRFPKSRKRLLQMIKESRRPGLFLISGDRHYGEISMQTNPSNPLYEITSSGLTHTKSIAWFRFGLEENRHRLGEPLVDLNFGLIDINFDSSKVSMKLCDQEGNICVRKDVLIPELSGVK